MRKQLDSLPISGYNKTDILDIRNIVRSIKFSCNDLTAVRERMREAGYTSFSTFGRDCILNTRVIKRVTRSRWPFSTSLSAKEIISTRLPEPAMPDDAGV